MQCTSSHTLPKIHCNIIFPSTPRSSKWSLPIGVSNQNIVCISHLPNSCYMPQPFHPLRFDHPNNIWCSLQVMQIQSRCVMFHNNLFSFCYVEELLSSRPTPKTKHHPLSAVCDCLFNIFAATLHISYIRNPRMLHAVVTGTHITYMLMLTEWGSFLNLPREMQRIGCLFEGL
jgi:hypothetical protein